MKNKILFFSFFIAAVWLFAFPGFKMTVVQALPACPAGESCTNASFQGTNSDVCDSWIYVCPKSPPADQAELDAASWEVWECLQGSYTGTCSISGDVCSYTSCSSCTAVASGGCGGGGGGGGGAVCGNNIVESGEQCDDGNTTGGDGCSATCQNEGGGGGSGTGSCSLSANPSSGNAPLGVSFQADVGAVLTNDICQYWDYDGNGSWDQSGCDDGGNWSKPISGWNSYGAGTYNAKFRIEYTGLWAVCTTPVVVSTPPKPIIDLNPQSFIFSAISGAAAPAAQNMVIKNTGDANLGWRWQRVNATGGASPVGVWCRLQNSGGTDITINTGGTLAPDASVTTKVAVNALSNAGVFDDCNIQIYDPNAINNPQNASIDYLVRPTNVSGVTATLAACPSQNITLSWTAASSGATAKTYTLYRNTTSSIPGIPYASGITTTTWTDSSAKTVGQTYYYWMEAVSGGLTSTNKVAANGGAGVSITACAAATVDLKLRRAGTTDAFIDGPLTINSGQSAELQWSSANATSCTASSGWTGSKATSGTETRGPLTVATTFTLQCTGSGGDSSPDSVTVNITGVDIPPTVSISSPVSSPSYASSNLAMTWRPSDDNGITKCELQLDGGNWMNYQSCINNTDNTTQLTYVHYDTGKIAAFDFAEDASLTAYDKSGSGRNGTLTNGTAWTAGKYGTALNFDGNNDYVSVPDFAPPTDLTIEAWIYPGNTVAGSEYIIANKHNSEYDFRITNNGRLFGSAGGTGLTDASFNFNSAPNVWYHVAYTFDNSANTHKLYINGSEVASGSNTANISNQSTALWIGRHSQFNFGSFLGKIDEVAIYNRALTAMEISNMFTDNAFNGTHTLNVRAYDNNITPQVSAIASRAFTIGGSATADIKANGSDGPITIPYNSNVNITWSSTNATSCSVSPTGWTGTSGNQTQTLVAGRTYTLTCEPGAVSNSVTVNVDVQEFTLSLIKGGQGTVISSPVGINCGPACSNQSAAYDVNTTVVLTAAPQSGRVFTGWGGACISAGKSPTCSVLIDGNKNIIANFAIDPTFNEF